MFDIDKYLDDIKIKEVTPTVALVEKTKKQISGAKRFAPKDNNKTAKLEKLPKQTRANHSTHKRISSFAKPLAALLVAAVMVVAFLLSPNLLSFRVAGAYTVDINPSICVNVDKNDEVVSVTAQNEDAKKLIAMLDCKGMGAAEAIKLIINLAKEAGYLDGHEKYVLVGRFGDNKEKDLDNLQQHLEDNLGDMIDLLVVSGTLAEKEEADELEVSAGLLKLSQMAGEEKPPKEEKVAEMVEKISSTYDHYLAPTLEAKVTDSGLQFYWSTVGFNSFGYQGKVKYKLFAGKTEAEVLAFGGERLGYYEFKSTDEQPLDHTVLLDTKNINADESRYYALYVLYENGVMMSSNIVFATMPAYPAIAKADPTPEPKEEPKNEPKEDPKPETPDYSYDVTGYVSGDNIVLNWDKAQGSGFTGYKIVASQTDSTPRYPDNGYLRYITDSSVTEKVMYEGYQGLKGGTYYYFSVTYLYKDRSIVGSTVRLKVPDKQDQPTVPESTMKATTITGSLSDTKVNLNWNKISHDKFSGYKVVMSKTNANPKYPDDGYIKYITNASTTSFSKTIDELEPGKTYYFSITVLYNDGTKKAGNAIALTMPIKEDETPVPEAPMVATNITGSQNGATVNLSWSKVTHEKFNGYKVVASKTNTNPKYPDDGYLKYITNSGTTSYSSSVDNFEAGKTYYFSITTLYNDGTKKAGNVVAITMPAAPQPDPTPKPEPDPAPYVSTNINGSINGNMVSVNWNKVTHDAFDGYKVVYSFTDASPVYGESGTSYSHWITSASTTSASMDITKLNGYTQGATCYFSITVLYDGHSVKKPGSVISFNVP